MKLPGTPRDLATMEEHLERAERNAAKLWEFDDMQLHHVGGGPLVAATTLLREVRQDLSALRSCISALQKEQSHGS